MEIFIFSLPLCAPGAKETWDTAEAFEELQEPTWGAAEAVTRLDEALGRSVVQPPELREAYLELLAHGDGQCPAAWDSIPPGTSPPEGCVASNGYVFRGWSEYQDLGVDHLVSGDFTVTDHQGRDHVHAGHSSVGFEQGVATALVQGSFAYPSHTGRLAPGVSVGLLHQLDGGVRTLQGGTSTPGTVEALFFDLSWSSECADGSVELRDPSGGWHSVDLECGCGPMSYGALDEGKVCVDTSAVLSTLEQVL